MISVRSTIREKSRDCRSEGLGSPEESAFSFELRKSRSFALLRMTTRGFLGDFLRTSEDCLRIPEDF
jgi:hypothetical protein